jgi:hypothetical protein
MSNKPVDIVYVVVNVMSGVIEGAKCFRVKSDAQRYLQQSRRKHSPNNDDVQLIATEIEESAIKH